MAVAGRFDYLLIESTGLWKACVTCLVMVLVNGVLPNSSTFAETGCTLAARYVSQANLGSAQTKVFWSNDTLHASCGPQLC